MKKIFAFAVVALMMLAIPAAAANYKLSGTFSGGYSYANETGTDSLSLTLKFNFDEAGIMTAYAPLTLTGGLAVTDGWWVNFATAPLNFVISDNNDTYGWSGLESTFSLNSDSTFNYGVTDNEGNRYSKVWGNITPGLSYAAQVVMDDTSNWLPPVVTPPSTPGDDYKISGQLVAALPLGLTLTSDFGWLYETDAYYMGLSTSLTGAIPVIGGKFQVAVGNFADLDNSLIPSMQFWAADDVWAFAAYAGVKEIKLGTVLTIDEVSYKMSMPGVADQLLDEDTPSFYTRDLQEVTTNATAVLGPVKVVFKNGVWFHSFNALGGNNANLDVSAAVGPVALGLNLDSKINWESGFAHGEIAELRAEYVGLIGKLGGKLGYNSNWDGVAKYGFGTGYDKVYGSVYYDAVFPLHVEAYGSYEQKGTNTAKAGIYAKYENTYTTVPYVVDLKTLVAGRFGYTWTEVPTNTMEAIGMLKLDSTINGLWSAGLLFISRNNGSPALSFEPIASVYAKYKASDMVTVTGTVTYRGEDVFAPVPVPVSVTPVHAIYAKLQGDIKVSDNAKATVYWGNTGLKSVSSSNADYAKPWGPYFEVVSPMYWDSFGASFTIKF